MNTYPDIILKRLTPDSGKSLLDEVRNLKSINGNKIRIVLEELSPENAIFLNYQEFLGFELLELIFDIDQKKEIIEIKGFIDKINHKNKIINLRMKTSALESNIIYPKNFLASAKTAKDVNGICITYSIDSIVSHVISHFTELRKTNQELRHIILEFTGAQINSELAKLSLIEKDVSEIIEWSRHNDFTLALINFPLCYIQGFEGNSYETQILSKKTVKYSLIEQTRKANQDSISECNECSIKSICIGPDKEYVKRFGSGEIRRSFEQVNAIIEKVEDLPADFTDNSSNFTEKIKEDLKIFDRSLEVKNNKNNIYDTYSHYLMEGTNSYSSKEFILNCWKILVNRIKEGKEIDNVNLYLHFPFCISSCDYCIYPSVQYKDQKQIDDYLKFLASEIEYYAPTFKGIELKSLSIGGGTPSLMSEKQMEFLLSCIHKNFAFNPNAEKGIEFNPNTTTLEKLRIIEKYGFNKLSIGVQTLSKEVLADINRGYQTFESVKKAVEGFNQTKIGYMNIDLLIGLKKDTPENFLYTLEEVLKLKPSIITVYPIKTNDNYLKSRFGTKENFFKFYYPLFDEISQKIKPIVDKYNYSSSMSFDKLSYVHPFDLFPKDGSSSRRGIYSYSNFKSSPYSNLGLGFYAQSNVNDLINYLFIAETNERNSTLFLKNFSTNPADYRFFVSGFLDNYSKVKFITTNVSESFSIDRIKYQQMFKKDICDDFAQAIKALTHLGKIAVLDNKIIFNVKKELELYSLMLFFVGRKVVKDKISQWSGILTGSYS